ncbi:hypothetical protein [Alteribacillus sp. YIM 98480]|uniref:hypothetical protein n=1 Tax=Alteribacillus sp. YIM 98480 TaxID=2606599 RepID=UPI00131A8D79|nr:hypothetical protein [Alteribacillus sp. YIM 98480]
MKTRVMFFIAFLMIMVLLGWFYRHNIAPDTHYVEVQFATITAYFITILFAVTLFISKKQKMLFYTSYVIIFTITAAGISMWVVRPYVIINDEVPKRMEILDAYLEETYPDRDWDIQKSESTFDSHYLFYVTFAEEADYSYAYHMSDDVINGKDEIQSTGGRPNK